MLGKLIGANGAERSEVSGGGQSRREQPAVVAAEEVQGALVELYWPDEAACSLLLCLRHRSPAAVRWSHELKMHCQLLKCKSNL